MHIAILGAGPAGLFCARQLSAVAAKNLQEDLAISVIDPRADSPSRNGLATPILVPLPTLRRFHPKYETADRIIKEGRFVFKDKTVSIKKIAGFMANKTPLRFFDAIAQDWGAPDYYDLVSDLKTDIQAQASVHISAAQVTDVAISSNKITALALKNLSGVTETMIPDLIIDASGRDTPISRLINSKYPETIQEKRYPKQASLILSGYFNFRNVPSQHLFNNLNDTIYMSILPTGLYIAVLPVLPMSESDATHLVLVEGDGQVLSRIHKSSIANPGLDASATFLQTFKTITMNSVWEELFSQAPPPYRPIMFNYRGGVMRSSTLKNYSMVGDALFNANPLFSQGMRWVADSSDLLAGMLTKSAWNIDAACQEYHDHFVANDFKAMKSYSNSYACLKAIMKFRKLLS